MILVQLVQNVLTEFSNFAIGHHHVLTVIVYHNGEIPPPPWLGFIESQEIGGCNRLKLPNGIIDIGFSIV